MTTNERECFVCLDKFNIPNAIYPYTFSPHRDEKNKPSNCKCVAHKKCILDYLKKSPSYNYERIASCPMCRGKVYTMELDQNYLDEIMIKLSGKPKSSEDKIKCFNSNKGCEYSGTHYNLLEHMWVCQHKEPLCPNGCGKLLKHNEVNSHIKEDCELRKIKCEKCGGEWPAKEGTIQDHLNNECYDNFVMCEMCFSQTPKCTLSTTHRNNCVIVCNYCMNECKSHKIKEHLNNKCEKYTYKCNQCNKQIPMYKKIAHPEQSCDTKCDKCGTKILIKYYETHLNQECFENLINVSSVCKVCKKLGSTQQVAKFKLNTNEKIKSHLLDNHMDLLMDVMVNGMSGMSGTPSQIKTTPTIQTTHRNKRIKFNESEKS